MRDLLDAAGLIFVAFVFMLICAIAVPLGLLVALVWAPAEGVVNFCRGACRLRDR
jgi:hypothetical protein